MRKWITAFFIVSLLVFIADFPSLKYGFSQDDFIHLSASQASSAQEFLNFFNPFYQYPDIFFYRPLTTQVYFFINKTLFGLNPVPFHIESLILHLVNSILFFLIIKKIWQNKNIAFVSALFYAVSAAHFLSLYYISAFQQVCRTFFIFLSILMFFKYQDTKQKSAYLGSLIAFLAALLSKETSIVLPLLFLPLEILRNRTGKLKTITQMAIKSTIPFVVVVLIYGIVRFTGLQSVFNEGSYNTTFSFSDILQNLKWYIIWSLGLPEILSTYPSLKPDSLLQFGKDLPFGFLVLILSALVGIISLLLLPSFKQLTKRMLFASAAIFLLSLSPILILSQHRYPQYLDLAFMGLLPIPALLFSQKTTLKRFLGVIGILTFIALQLLSLKLSEQTHWTTHRAKIADKYYRDFINTYPTLSNNTTVVFVGTKQAAYELSITLAQKYGLSVWYPEKIKDVRYLTIESLGEGETKTIIYPITAY